MAKKEINIEQFRAIIKEEAMKLNQRVILENEKKALIKEFNECGYEERELEMNTGDNMGAPMDEAAMEELFGSGKRKEEKMKSEFLKYASIWKKKGAIRGMNQQMLDVLMQQAAADNFAGKPGIDKAEKLMMYRKGDDINWGGLGLNQGGSFGGTGAEE